MRYRWVALTVSVVGLAASPAHALNETSIGGLVSVCVAGLVLLLVAGAGVAAPIGWLTNGLIWYARQPSAGSDAPKGPAPFTERDSIGQAARWLCLAAKLGGPGHGHFGDVHHSHQAKRGIGYAMGAQSHGERDF